MSSFEEWIERREWDILNIRDRLGLLIALERLLTEQAVNEEIRVANRAVFQLAKDSYEMLIIDLASFFTGLLQRGPGLNQLNNHLSRLRVGKRPKPSAEAGGEPDHVLEGIVHQHRTNAFARLFPECTKAAPGQSEVAKLKDRLDKRSTDCRSLRDQVHAHRYEHRNDDGEDTKPLDLPAIADLLVEAQETFNALRLLVLGSEFGYGDIQEPIETARDLRELILHGSVNGFCLKLGVGSQSMGDRYYWQLRAEYYESDEWEAERGEWAFSK